MFFLLLLTGAIQYGLMYLCYIEAFRYLAAHEVALYTIFTPLYVIIFYNLKKREANLIYLFSSAVAVAGSAILYYNVVSLPESLLGFFLVQLSNLAFAYGQVIYKLLPLRKAEIKQHQIFAILFLGGLLVTIPPLFNRMTISTLSLNWSEIVSLLYLGILPSAGCFFLWNYGARKTDAGYLSVFNNLKVPIAMFISFFFFGETIKPFSLTAGTLILLFALFSNRMKFPLIKQPASHPNPSRQS